MVWWPNMDCPKFWIFKMCNFDISVVHLSFWAILGDPKFGSFHIGSPHHVAVTGYTWLIVVINSNNELCSRSNNTVSKAFWQKKVLPEQRISCCEGIHCRWLVSHRTRGGIDSMDIHLKSISTNLANFPNKNYTTKTLLIFLCLWRLLVCLWRFQSIFLITCMKYQSLLWICRATARGFWTVLKMASVLDGTFR